MNLDPSTMTKHSGPQYRFFFSHVMLWLPVFYCFRWFLLVVVSTGEFSQGNRPISEDCGSHTRWVVIETQQKRCWAIVNSTEFMLIVVIWCLGWLDHYASQWHVIVIFDTIASCVTMGLIGNMIVFISMQSFCTDEAIWLHQSVWLLWHFSS